MNKDITLQENSNLWQPRQYGEMDIIYQDMAIVVINKPGGLLAVPGRGPEKQDCAASRLRSLFPAMISQPAVHRLDMYTSGLMVFAVTAEAHRELSRQFADREVEKRYTAVLTAVIAGNSGRIALPFRLDPFNRPLQVYDPVKGKMGVTLWRKISVAQQTTRVEFTPLTGRTHQLRIHAAHPLGLGAPIAGDSLYGSAGEGDQMMLHAASLHFRHPVTNAAVAFSSAPPF